jgi:ornithine decarboxylase
MNLSGAHIAPLNNFSIKKDFDKEIWRIQSQLNEDEAFRIGNFKTINNIIQIWKENGLNIQIHYAMKCCNEPNLLKYLIKNGIGFDCASRTEIEAVLGLGVESSQIVFSHPIKSIDSLIYSKSKEVDKVVFESENELKKILKYHEKSEVYLRVKPIFLKLKLN